MVGADEKEEVEVEFDVEFDVIDMLGTMTAEGGGGVSVGLMVDVVRFANRAAARAAFFFCFWSMTTMGMRMGRATTSPMMQEQYAPPRALFVGIFT